MPTIDVENAWGLDATAFGNHEFDYGVDADPQARRRGSNFPFLSANIVETATGQPPACVKPSTVFRVNGVCVGVIGATVKNTPELVAAGNTAGLSFLDEAERIKRESQRAARAGRQGPGRRHPRGRAAAAPTRSTASPAAPWDGPDHRRSSTRCRTRPSTSWSPGTRTGSANTVVGTIPVVEGFNAGVSYSVAQLMVDDGDVAVGGRGDADGQEPRRRRQRPDVKAIVDKANADTLRRCATRVIGSADDRHPARPDRLQESAMGNLVADAMRDKYAEADAAITNSGGLRADIFRSPPSARRAGRARSRGARCSPCCRSATRP